MTFENAPILPDGQLPQDVYKMILGRFEVVRSELNGPTTAEWFAALLLCLLIKARNEFVDLRNVGRLPEVSWHCRTLLELVIQTKFVTSNEQNARTYEEDHWIDALELFEAYRALGSILQGQLDAALSAWGMKDEETHSFEALEKTIQNVKQEIERRGIAARPYMSVVEMAKTVDMVAEFQKVNKITSKLVHPTAHSVLVPTDARENRVAGEMLTHLRGMGQRYTLEVLGGIQRHVQQWGLQPARSGTKG